MQEIIVRYPGDLDATGTFDAAVDKIAAGRNPEEVARFLLDTLTDEEQEGLRSAARGGGDGDQEIDPRGPGARLRYALEIEDPRSVKWLPGFSPRAVIEILRERDEARTLLASAIMECSRSRAARLWDSAALADVGVYFIDTWTPAARQALGSDISKITPSEIRTDPARDLLRDALQQWGLGRDDRIADRVDEEELAEWFVGEFAGRARALLAGQPEPEPRPDAAREVLEGTLKRWKFHKGIHDEPIEGGEMVAWFIAEFVPLARRALGIEAIRALEADGSPSEREP